MCNLGEQQASQVYMYVQYIYIYLYLMRTNIHLSMMYVGIAFSEPGAKVQWHTVNPHWAACSGVCCKHFANIFGTHIVDAIVSQVYMTNREVGP